MSAITHDITSAPLLPLVRNVRIEPDGLTPTLLWEPLGAGISDSVDRIERRIAEHFDTGATQVCLQPFSLSNGST